MKILIVRLGALGDLVHALPVAAALGERFPEARIDWIVDGRYEALLGLVRGIDRVWVIRARPAGTLPGLGEPAFERFAGRRGLVAAIRALRATRYDVALDLQGLVKSAAIARLSGARRVVGFARGHVRESAAALFYGERVAPASGRHVIHKNLALLGALGIDGAPLRFPIGPVGEGAVVEIRRELGLDPAGAFVVLVPGAGWPNKCWPPERFGAVAAALGERRGLRSVVLWGPGERVLADRAVRASAGAAIVAPATTLSDLVAVGGAARLVVAGDSGPMHLAASAGAPIVALLGPTDPARNGPWHPDDEAVSRYDRCECHYRRRCARPSPCIDDITVEEVVAACERRLDRR